LQNNALSNDKWCSVVGWCVTCASSKIKADFLQVSTSNTFILPVKKIGKFYFDVSFADFVRLHQKRL